MKRLLAIMLSLVLVLSLTACGSKHDDIIEKAITELEKIWVDQYSEHHSSIKTDGYFEIKNTRVIEIKDNENEMFKDIDYVIEFVLFTDYYGSAPYYYNVGIYDTVVVYKNGKTEASSKTPFLQYVVQTYSTDYSDFIESVTDYGDKYNCKKHLDF